MRSRLLAAVGLAALCGSALGAPGTAAAAGAAGDDGRSRIVLRDGPGDVQRVQTVTSGVTDAGRFPRADVLRAVVRHDGSSLSARMRFLDLQRVGRSSYWMGLTVAPGEFRFVRVLAHESFRSGRAAVMVEPGGDRIACPGLDHRIDYATDTVSIRLPRECIGSPDWVRVNLSNLYRPRPGSRYGFGDNPHNATLYSNFGTPRLYAD